MSQGSLCASGYFSLGAIEKQKLVYILNRDAAARLTISSPLEAHKANTLVYHVVGVDVGFENPMFACLEMDYEVRSNLMLDVPTMILSHLIFYLVCLKIIHWSQSLVIVKLVRRCCHLCC